MFDSPEPGGTPYLSIVAAFGHAQRGAKWLIQTQAFLDAAAGQAERHALPIEIILVDWNARFEPTARVLLHPLPRSPLAAIRILTVPEDLIRSEQGLDRERRAQNIGIRRARGEFVLAVGSDTVLTSDLFAHLAARPLAERCAYHALRFETWPDYLDGQRPSPGEIEHACRSASSGGGLAPHLITVDAAAVSASEEAWQQQLQAIATEAILDELENPYEFCPTNFLLLARKSWIELGGYPEWRVGDANLDRFVMGQVRFGGWEQKLLPAPCHFFSVSRLREPDIEDDFYVDKYGDRRIRIQPPPIRNLSHGTTANILKGFENNFSRTPGLLPIVLKTNGSDWGLPDRELEDQASLQIEHEFTGGLTGMATRVRLGDAIRHQVDLSRFETAPGAQITFDGGRLTIVTQPAHGVFAAAIPLGSFSSEETKPVFVDFEGGVSEGPVGLVFATPDMRQSIGPTVKLTPGPRQRHLWPVDGIEQAYWLLVRNDGADGTSGRIEIDHVRVFARENEALPTVADAAPGRLGHVDVAGLAAVADAVTDPAMPLVAPPPVTIDVVPVELLGPRLGFKTGFDPSRASRKPLTQWRMEDDDQPIFRYLYREFKPKRHLEFGTWHGAGTVYCLDESDATVWTINLAEGEMLPDGRSAYGMGTDVATDSGAMIGKLYREAGYGHRVCQIYTDSCLWDTRNYPPGFFDSILIDGGHQARIVLSDTLKAIELLRPGGLCLWHDFAPDPAVFSVSTATIGVAQGIRAAWPAISATMRDVFYIWPSQILVGVRR